MKQRIAIIPLILLSTWVISSVYCVTWEPQLGNFDIIEFDNLGEITNIKTVNLTICCVEGSGSVTIKLKTDPIVPLSFIPTFGIPSMEAGDNYTKTITVQNLGTETTRDFVLIATVEDSFGTVTDNATSSGTILKKTGVPTYLYVSTKCRGDTINNLPITIEYFDYTQTKNTGLNGAGLVKFDLETSADITTKVIFEGNDVYESASTTVTVLGGEEKTITFDLNKLDGSTDEGNSNWEIVVLVLGIGAMATILGVVYLLRKRS